MDHDYINRLQKNLDDLFLSKSQELVQNSDFGKIRELQGYIKAISAFGRLIVDNMGERKANE